ncbi:MAG: PKD domain-containing protein [Pseudonocardiales bacterium]|nr:PKD domain-containing protein [Pseudonocardiales bacterium]
MAALAAALIGVGLCATPAAAVQPVVHDVVTDDDPVNWTPHVLDGDVRAITEIGGRVLVGGSFSRVANASQTTQYTRTNLFAFDAPSGNVLTSFAPSLPGMVYAIADAGDGQTAYVAGQFNNVNGAAATNRVARINITTGAVVSTFRSPGFNGTIKNVVVRGDRLFVGGNFTTAGGTPRPALAMLDRETGALDNALNLGFSDPRNGGALQVLKFDVSPDGSRLVAIGNFTRINGLDRYQAAMIDLTTAPVSVADWSTQRFTSACASAFDTYMRDIDISQDGRYFVIVTTGAFAGGAGSGTLCDTASRWDFGPTGPNQQPTWVNYSGGDTLWGVGVASEAVYVGGHQRWMNNPFAGDRAGPGSVVREGIAALDPRSGIPLSWNPGRTRGVGVFELTATARGLYIGSDTDRFATEFHGRLALTPTAGGAALPADFTGQLPGDVYSLGSGLTNSVVRRAFTGSATTGAATLPADGTAWGEVRGAFMVDGTVYSGRSTGVLETRSFNGSAFGAPTTVNLNGLTDFATELRTITGSFFDAETGRMYYTLAGQNTLYYRGFSTESRIVGAQRLTAVGGLTDLNWSQVSSMFQVGDNLYVASSADGNLRRYAWTPAGPVAGNLPVAGSGTVVSGPGVDGSDWRARGAFALALPGGGGPANQPPTAAFTHSCSGLSCSFASTSTDTDGTIAATSWSFGDGGTATGTNATHDFAAAGTYTVTETVTDDDGASTSVARPVTVAAQNTAVAFRAAAASDANTTAARVTVPAAVRAGDAMLLWATVNTSSAVTAPAGWTAVASADGNGIRSVLFSRTAAAGDAGQVVTVPVATLSKTSLQLVAYGGTAAGPPAAQAVAVETVVRATHTTPTVTVGTAGSLVLSYWADKTSATTTWALPAGVVQRSTTLGTGSGRIVSVTGDSGAGVAAGPAGGLTATADSSGAKAVMWTVVLAPAG